MADSDDEYDRKRRDKFRGERSAGDSYRSERRDDRRGGGGGRDDWNDRGRARPDYSDYRSGGRGGRDRYSPGRDMPPAKRMRPDWGDEPRPRYGGHEGYPMYGWGHEPYPMHPAHGGYGGGHPQANNHGRGENASNTDMQTQPPMLTLKQFLDTQDDTISDSEVLRKYSDYKLEFKRQQLNEFFVAHKDEEWFKNKYHPEESLKRKDEQFGFLKKRVDVFSELLEKGQITSVSVDTNQTDPLLRLLDTVVIKLEGGTEDDLKALDEKPPPIQDTFSLGSFQSKFDSKRSTNDKDDDDVIITEVQPIAKRVDDFNEADWACPPPAKASTSKGNDGDDWDSIDPVELTKKKSKANADDDWDSFDAPPKKKQAAGGDTGDNWDSVDDVPLKKEKKIDDDDDWESFDNANKSKDKPKDENRGKSIVASPQAAAKSNKDDWDADDEPAASTSRARKRSRSSSSSSSSSSSRDGDNENDRHERKSPEPIKKEEEKSPKNSLDQVGDDKESAKIMDIDEPVKDIKKVAEPDEDIPDEKLTQNQMEEDHKNEQIKKEEDVDVKLGEKQEEKIEDVTEKKPEEDEENKTVTIDLDKEKDPEPELPKPRALHRTSSIFLRNLAPTITKSEIEAVCKRYDGFLRVAIADPLVERRWFRRGWVTFKRDVNIKEICWNLNNIRLRDCEMGAIVNRDLSRRVRPVNGVTAHKTIVRSDIKLCAKIALNLDDKFNLWSEDEKKEGAGTNGDTVTQHSFGFKSKNPVLQNITDFLIEEASAEEEELLGLTGSENKDSADGEILDRDPQLITVLDKLILYLRIVHSVDFYNHCEYPYEDEMPNRCGIIHARGPAPQNKITNNDIQDYIKNFENKMTSFLAKSTSIEEEELKNLGIKNPEAEVEKFVQANTQELAKDKWLCPLSGKKFKGPEFIRKHIFNKHVEKVDEVRKEVEYFNNYLRDPKRPQLPEHPGNTRRQPAEAVTPQMPYRQPYGAPAYAPPYAAYAPPMVAPPRPRGFGMGGGGRRGQGGDYRPIIHYRDLDAPHESVDML